MRLLTRTGLEAIVERLQGLPTAQIAELPGVSPNRAHQMLAGAVVALEAFTAFGVDRAEICPWAMREGVVLRRLDWLEEDRLGRPR